MIFYSYKSEGILSHYIRDYANDNVSSLSGKVVAKFLFQQSQTQRISDVNYGTVSDFGSTGVSIDNSAILIVGRGFPGFVGSASTDVCRSYVYEPNTVDLYSEIDYGTLSFNPTPATATETVAVDNLNATLTNTFLTDSGTGTGATGGFNIGRHIRFNSSTAASRIVEFSLPNNVNSSLTFEVIRGNDINGGEDPDLINESLYLEYYDGSSWTSIDTVVAHNDTTFNALKSVEITIPSVARTAGTQFRLIQPSHNGNNWDHYGLKSVTYSYQYTPTIPSINFGSILDDNVTLEDYGRIVYALSLIHI